MAEISFAKVGGPPANWRELVVHCDGVELRGVVEADAAQSYAVCYKGDGAGGFVRGADDQAFELERVEGVIAITRRAPR